MDSWREGLKAESAKRHAEFKRKAFLVDGMVVSLPTDFNARNRAQSLAKSASPRARR
jgi:hypothetical protein